MMFGASASMYVARDFRSQYIHSPSSIFCDDKPVAAETAVVEVVMAPTEGLK